MSKKRNVFVLFPAFKKGVIKLSTRYMTSIEEQAKAIVKGTPLCKNDLEDLYRYLGFQLGSCNLVWDAEAKGGKGSKRTLNAWKMDDDYPDTHHFKPREDPCWIIYTHLSKLVVIDIDADSDEARRVFEMALPVCKMVVKTKKGYHLYFIDNGELEHKINTGCHIDIIGGGDGRHFIIAPPSFYNDGTKTYHYQLLTYPDDPKKKSKHDYADLSPLSEELIEYLYTLGFKKPGQNTIVNMPSTPRTDTPKSLDDIKLLCECLTPKWLSDFENWKKLAYCLKTLNCDDDMMNLFLETSARGTGYDGTVARNDNQKFWRSIRPAGRLTIGSLKHWAKLCSPQKYFDNARGDYLRLLTGNPLGVNSNSLCELFINEMAGDIMYSVSDKDYYIYDPATTLWKGGEGVRAIVNHVVVDICQRAVLKVLDGINGSSIQDAIEVRKQLMRVAKLIDGKHAVNLVNDYLPAFCVPPEDPLTYFDNNPGLLPLANGVWSFTENRLVPYQREHYFTHKMDFCYNPNADDSLIRRGMNDWFNKNQEVIDFVQMYMGYMMTGYTDRQEILVVWGNEAGNGKSLLWGEIMPSLMSRGQGKTKYYARITSDAFADTGNPNNDQLYYLNGKRYAFMSEPRRGVKSAFDNELLKTITGDKDFTAQAKYKNKLTFRLMCKIVCACNDLPEFNFDDKGTYRRVVILEQNIPCMEESDYLAVPQEVRDKGLVVKKDKAFVDALLADREGTLRWVMEGAIKYMNSPLQPVPEVMKASKAKAKETVDVLSQWLKGNIEAGNKSLTFKEIKDEWKNKGLNFEQNKKGFSQKLASKIRLLGYTVDEGRPGKAEEKVLRCALVPDNFEGQID
jgi:hypothetical protein